MIRSIARATLVLGIGMAGIAHAASEVPQIPKRFGFVGILSTTRSVIQYNDNNYVSSSAFWMIPSYKLSESFKIGSVVVLGQKWTGEQRFDVTRSEVYLKQTPIPLNKYLRFSHTDTFLIPGSKTAREFDSLRFGIKFAPRLTLDLAPVGVKGLTTYYELSLARLFHQYETAISGASNKQHVLSNVLNATYAPVEQWAFSSTFLYSTNWTYQGTQANKFEFEEEVDFKFSPSFSIGLGLNNGGNTLGPNGQDSNMAVFNPTSAVVFGQIVYTY